MATWCKEHVIKLIAAYERHTCLYDTRHRDYSNRMKRDSAINTLCVELNKYRPTKADEVRKKIKTLRSQYCKEKAAIRQSRENGAGGNDVYQPKLWFYDRLQFLDRFTQDKELIEDRDDKDDNFYIKTEIFGTSFMDEENGVDKVTNGSMDASTYAQQSVSPVHKKRKLDAGNRSSNQKFADFIAAELDTITDANILRQTKWKIHSVLIESLQNCAPTQFTPP